jgi:flagellar biosynthesis regulator FlbT
MNTVEKENQDNEVTSPSQVVPEDQPVENKESEVTSPSQVVPNDQQVESEVTSPSQVVPEDQPVENKESEVTSPSQVVPDDQPLETKESEVTSPSQVVTDDQPLETKESEVTSPSQVVPEDQPVETKESEVTSPSQVVTDDQTVETKESEVTSPSQVVTDDQTVEIIFSKYIDQIIYINLDIRNDRREQFEKEFNQMGLCVERFSAILNTDSGIGCFISHLEVLRLAKARNLRNVLIMEDDFTFLVSKEEFEQEISKLFDQEIDYDVCLLSYNLKKTEETKYDFLGRALNSSTASGYLVNAKHFDKLINLFEQTLPLLRNTKRHWEYANDVIWMKLMEKDNWYYFKTRIGKQAPGYADNAHRFTDYNF